MTSFPICKKMSISRKLSAMEAMLLMNTNSQGQCRPYRICHQKTIFGVPKQRIYHDDVIPGLQETSLCLKRCILEVKLPLNTYRKSCRRPLRIRLRELNTASPGVNIAFTLFPVQKKTSLCRKRCITHKNLYGILIGSRSHPFKIRVLYDCKNSVQRHLTEIKTSR